MRILVTGASGLLGSQLARLAVQGGHEVLAGYNVHLPAAGVPVHLDLSDLETLYPAVLKAHAEVVIHTAAISDVDLCEEKEEFAKLINGEATGKIGEAAKQAGAYVVYVSTDYVFNGRTGLYKEEDEPDPISFYGESKLLGERLLRESGATYCIARTSVLYGWGREHRPNFGTWVISKLKSNESVRVVNDQFVSPTLNHNLAEMLLDLATKRFEGILHVAGATRIDRYDFALQIARTFNLNPNLIEPVKSDEIGWKAKRPRDSSLNVEKANTVLDRKPLSLPEALERFRAGLNN